MPHDADFEKRCWSALENSAPPFNRERFSALTRGVYPSAWINAALAADEGRGVDLLAILNTFEEAALIRSMVGSPVTPPLENLWRHFCATAIDQGLRCEVVLVPQRGQIVPELVF